LRSDFANLSQWATLSVDPSAYTTRPQAIVSGTLQWDGAANFWLDGPAVYVQQAPREYVHLQ
jgi:hypothetical protein